MPCIKVVVNAECCYCHATTIKFGKLNGRQRYRCKSCKRTFLNKYLKKAYETTINSSIAAFIKEGSGIRSIARLLHISTNTVLSRIKAIANVVIKPIVTLGRTYEVDELRTYVGNKSNECWIIYALDRQTGHVVDFKVGRRTKTNLKTVTDTLLLANCKLVYTDGLKIYCELMPRVIHKVRRYGTNKIERKNLSLRTHLKRLNRKTICFSRNIGMLEACLKIYLWHDIKSSVTV